MAERDKPKKKTVIHIDRKKFDVEQDGLTGAQLRALPEFRIGQDRELFLEVPGGEDQPIGDDQSVELENGMHFFSAPREINPGS